MFKERLSAYESIEKDLDQVITQVANNETPEIIGAITGAPTSTKRRV